MGSGAWDIDPELRQARHPYLFTGLTQKEVLIT
jgi:hypothetical protein